MDMRSVQHQALVNEWKERILAQRNSGQNVRQWCEKNGEKEGNYYYWLKKYGEMAHTIDETFPESLHAHMFRHSIAMAMYKKGISISYIRDFLTVI